MRNISLDVSNELYLKLYGEYTRICHLLECGPQIDGYTFEEYIRETLNDSFQTKEHYELGKKLVHDIIKTNKGKISPRQIVDLMEQGKTK